MIDFNILKLTMVPFNQTIMAFISVNEMVAMPFDSKKRLVMRCFQTSDEQIP